jgi:hypothetical protein
MHARMRPGGARIDAADAGMRVRAAHEGCLQHAGQAQIPDEPAAAGEQRTVLDPPDRFPDICGFWHGEWRMANSEWRVANGVAYSLFAIRYSLSLLELNAQPRAVEPDDLAGTAFPLAIASSKIEGMP